MLCAGLICIFCTVICLGLDGLYQIVFINSS